MSPNQASSQPHGPVLPPELPPELLPEPALVLVPLEPLEPVSVPVPPVLLPLELVAEPVPLLPPPLLLLPVLELPEAPADVPEEVELECAGCAEQPATSAPANTSAGPRPCTANRWSLKRRPPAAPHSTSFPAA